jgi:hypothetical protein
METCRADSIKDFFIEFQPKDYEDYDDDIALAVREGDLKVLIRHTMSGKSVI